MAGGKVQLQPGAVPVGITGTRATLYREGRPLVTVTAQRVQYDTLRKELVAQGGVAAKSLDPANPRRFQCDTLTWHPDSQKLVGQGAVAAHYGALAELYGSRLETDLQLKTLELLP